ncbi:MAG: hypothetical protein AAF672_06700 [Pseudomonadota bacterium]
MLNTQSLTAKSVLLGSAAFFVITSAAVAENHTIDLCQSPYGDLPEGCEQANRDTALRVPTGPNTELEGRQVRNSDGFVLSIDGVPIDADERIVDQVRRTDIALEKADIRVQFDGLGAVPRLDVGILGEDRARRAGEVVTFQSRLNYPAFVERGEIRIIDREALGGPRVVAVQAIPPGGQTQLTLPEGRDLVAVHRVYDAKGRFDETAPIVLSEKNARALVDDVEQGVDTAAIRRIPVHGGAVTVSSNSVPQGARVNALGASVRPDAAGNMVIQRILPPGRHAIDVQVAGTGQSFTRDIEIPRSEAFTVGIAELTFGFRDSDDPLVEDSYERGRFAFYTKRKFASGLTVTASADTREEDLSDILRNFDEKDPRSLLNRIDPDETYPVFGDDSTSVNDAPTSGRFFVRAEKDGNFAQWGDFQARLNGNEYIRNERTLYGAQGYYASPEQVGEGQPLLQFQAYAANPDTLAGRDVFQGTGGSLYFLQRQDLLIGSETLTVEVRDRITGRVIERATLVPGRDYDINYIQGTIILTNPLNDAGVAGLISTFPGGDVQYNLVAQYEFTPTASDVDGFSYGARAQVQVTEQLSFGISAINESTGTADQKAVAADVVYSFGDRSYARLDVAHSTGAGFASSFSTDGGLILNNTTPTFGSGRAIKAEIKADFADLGLAVPGFLQAYVEDREQGFSSLDYQVTAATGDEQLWGFAVEARSSDRLTWAVRYDDYGNDVGDHNRELGAELSYAVTDRVTYSFAAEHIDRQTGTINGDRTDLAARVDVKATERLSYYVFAQGTAQNNGLEDNNRVGVGGSYKVSDNWVLDAEISGGSYGTGGRLLATYQSDASNSFYFGYELDPGRQIGNGTNYGRDRGQYIVGGKKQVSDRVSLFAENTYDLFGERDSLTSAYGAEYVASEYLTYDAAIKLGRVNDDVDGDFDRTALSFGVSYKDEQLSARGKVEFRHERGLLSGTNRDADTFLLDLTARYKIDETQRLLFDFEYADTDTDQSSVLDGRLTDLSLGYALRPVDNDVLNLLFKYRYLYDLYGQRIDGTDTPGAQQKSHVISVDAIYDVNRHWTVGGKIGARLSEISSGAGTPFVSNDAVLGVVNARYHLVHEWDLLVEGRVLDLTDAGSKNYGVLGAAYKHVGNNAKIGVGYNFGQFSDDLTDVTLDDKGLFINLIAKF